MKEEIVWFILWKNRTKTFDKIPNFLTVHIYLFLIISPPIKINTYSNCLEFDNTLNFTSLRIMNSIIQIYALDIKEWFKHIYICNSTTIGIESSSCTKCIVFPAEFGRMFEIWCNFKNVKNHRSSINASASFSRRRLNLYWSTKRRRPKRDAHKNKKLKFLKEFCAKLRTLCFSYGYINRQHSF